MTEDNVKEQLWLKICIITGTCRNTLSRVRVVLTVIKRFLQKNTGAFYLDCYHKFKNQQEARLA